MIADERIRRKTLNEIINTEHDYVKDLEVCQEVTRTEERRNFFLFPLSSFSVSFFVPSLVFAPSSFRSSSSPPPLASLFFSLLCLPASFSLLPPSHTVLFAHTALLGSAERRAHSSARRAAANLWRSKHSRWNLEAARRRPHRSRK